LKLIKKSFLLILYTFSAKKLAKINQKPIFVVQNVVIKIL